MVALQTLLKFIDKNHDYLVGKLLEFVEIASISTDPIYSKECESAAQWLVTTLSNIGFQATYHENLGKPIVLATGGQGNTHLLFYGHYDVQPVDPVSEWRINPFKPIVETINNEKVICGRGASDDKGQLMTFLNACAAYYSLRKSLPCKITILIEGEEECGSPSLLPFIKANRSVLKADHAIICDTPMWDNNKPAITTTLRGLLTEEIKLTAAKIDLHSGMYGGIAINPIQELAKLLADLHDDDGKVTIKNFYNNVPELDKSLKKSWSSLNFSRKKFLNDKGLRSSIGEFGYSPPERLWTRPTCEINGISGGYAGEGTKTIIPSMANAKISFRLVGQQNPEKIREEFRSQLRKKVNPNCKISFGPKKVASNAISIDKDNLFVRAAQKALTAEWGTPPVFIGCGGSIPIVSFLKDTLNLNCLLVGFSLDDDKIHSPNEKYNLSSFIKGSKSWIRILNELTS